MSIRTPTRVTPFSLTYGAEVVLPLEVEIPSLRVSLKGLVIDEDYHTMRFQELELLDEKCQASFDHMRVYQNCMSKAFNKKVNPREFQVRDLFLRENPKNQHNRDQKGNIEPNFLGPYIIIASFGSSAYLLSIVVGEKLLDPINVLHLKKFYP